METGKLNIAGLEIAAKVIEYDKPALFILAADLSSIWEEILRTGKSDRVQAIVFDELIPLEDSCK